MIGCENKKWTVSTLLVIIFLLFAGIGGQFAGIEGPYADASNQTSFGMYSFLTPTANVSAQQPCINWYINSSFDWIVMPYWGTTGSVASKVSAGGKKFIMETDIQQGIIAANHYNWTDIHNSLQGNKSLYNEALGYVVAQINETGLENIYAVTIGEEEPQSGYYWNDSTVNVSNFIAVQNHIYNDLKVQFSGIQVFSFVHIAQFTDAQLATLKMDGLVDDVYDSNISAVIEPWFRRMMQFGGEETYCIVHASSNYAHWADLITPSIVRQTAELAQSMGGPHLGWFAFDFSPPATKEILFNNWPACADPNDSHCPGNFKDTILDIVNMAQPTPTSTLTPTSTSATTPTSTDGPDNEWWTISYNAVEGSYIVLNYSVGGITPTYKKITFNESDGISITMQISKTVTGGAREVIIPSSGWVFPMFEINNFMTGIDTVDLQLSLNKDATGTLYVNAGIGDVDASSKSTSGQSPIQIDTFGNGIKDSAGSLLMPTDLLCEFETTSGQYGELSLGLTFTTGHSTNLIHTASNSKINGAILASDGVPFSKDGGIIDYVGTAGTIVTTGTGDCLGIQLVGMRTDLQTEIKLVLESTVSWEISTPTITPNPTSTNGPNIKIPVWIVIGFVSVILLVAIAMSIIRRRR